MKTINSDTGEILPEEHFYELAFYDNEAYKPAECTETKHIRAWFKGLGESESERELRLSIAEKNEYKPEVVERLHDLGIKKGGVDWEK